MTTLLWNSQAFPAEVHGLNKASKANQMRSIRGTGPNAAVFAFERGHSSQDSPVMATHRDGTRHSVHPTGYNLMVIVCAICAIGVLVEASAKAETAYFPPKAFVVRSSQSGLGDVSATLDSRYSEALRAMGEPSLWESSREGRRITAYRLLWLPTSGRPVAVRIEKVGDRVALSQVQLDGDGGYDVGRIALHKQAPLSAGQWDRLKSDAERCAYWSMPTSIEDLGVDGEHLIVDSVRDGKYQIVDRCSPPPGPYRELCRTMLELAGLTLGGRRWPATPSLTPTPIWLTGISVLVLAVCLVGVVRTLRNWERRRS